MSATFTMDNALIRLSPNWRLNGSTFADTPCPGATIDFGFSGTSLGLTVDPSIHSALTALQYPAFEYNIDGGSWTRHQVASGDTTVSLASSLSAGSHTGSISYVGCEWSGLERWDGSAIQLALRCTAVVLDTAATLSAVTLPTQTLLVLGDSNAEGQEASGSGVSVLHQNARLAFSTLLGPALTRRVAVVGVSGQGFAQAGGGNVPALPSAFDHTYAATSRLSGGVFSPMPSEILVVEGINGTTSAATVTAFIASLRAAAPLAPILIAVPWTGAAAAALATGVTNAADANAHLINTGVTSYSGNSVHLTSAGHIAYAADLATLITPYLAQPGHFTTTFAGGIR